MSLEPIFRFAPSPNGFLHLGHAYSALLNARAAAALGGTMLLRIEDIDLARCKPQFAEAIFEDLQWLGLSWPEPVMRQSERFTVYAEAAGKLKREGLLYPCFCSRSEIAAKATDRDPDGAPLYPGTCRNLGEDDGAERFARGEKAQWRLKMDEALVRTGPLTYPAITPMNGDIGPYFTLVAAPSPTHPERWSDVVLIRKDTPTSYHLSVVVDDAAQGVTHIVRGQDLLAATDVHVVLQKLLGLSTPDYWHHGLIRDEEDNKLAKSRGSRSLRDLRAEGWTRDDVFKRLRLEQCADHRQPQSPR